MNNGNNKSHFSKIIVLVVSLIVLGISGTYAYYTTTIKGSPSTTRATSGSLKITSSLESASAINNTKIKLIDAADKEIGADKVNFTVTNATDATVSAKYYVYLKNITLSKNLYSSYFKWELVRNGVIVGSGTFAEAIRTSAESVNETSNVITQANDILLHQTALDLGIGQTDTLVFKMWLENDENVNQIDLTNGSFSGRLYLEAVPVSENN